MRFKVKRNRFEAIPQGNRPKLEAWLKELEVLATMKRAQQIIEATRRAGEQGSMIPLALGIDLPLKRLITKGQIQNEERTEDPSREGS